MSGARPDTWMPLDIGRYLADTMHLNPAQHGVYLLLIMAYWRRGGPLPDDDAQLSAIGRLTIRDWLKSFRIIIGRFFKIGNGVWWHKRIELELEKAAKNIARATAGGEGKARNKRPASSPQAANKQDPSICLEPAKSLPQVPIPIPLPEEEREEGGANAPSPAPLENDVSSEERSPSGRELRELVSLWNEGARRVGLSRADRLTNGRRQLLAARVRGGSAEEVAGVFAKVFASPFLRGERNGKDHPNFKAQFDWVLKEGNYVKILEGNYDEPGRSNGHDPGPPEGFRPTLDPRAEAEFGVESDGVVSER